MPLEGGIFSSLIIAEYLFNVLSPIDAADLECVLMDVIDTFVNIKVRPLVFDDHNVKCIILMGIIGAVRNIALLNILLFHQRIKIAVFAAEPVSRSDHRRR